MAMSGVELDAECKVVYDEVQSKKKHRYVTFMIDGGKIKIGKEINSSLFHHKMEMFFSNQMGALYHVQLCQTKMTPLINKHF